MPQLVQLLIWSAVENLPSIDPEALFIGIISGTSIDAIDAALVRFGDKPELIATHTRAYPPELQAELRRLCTPGENEIDRLGRADVEVGRRFAETIQGLLEQSGTTAANVKAVGSHGQTIRHRPDSQPTFTLQIGDPNVIAARTGIAVVADFRRKDLALGGQGAPLVPAFHAAVFSNAGEARAVVNLGGIANVTILPASPDGPVLGFDTGPGNTLLDAWARHSLGQPMDQAGAFAASGRVVPALLDAFLADSYFKLPPPKSTGPEYFSSRWLQDRLIAFPQVSPADVQATLAALTAHSVAAAVIGAAGNQPSSLFLCGGGVRNPVLVELIRACLPGWSMRATDDVGIDAGWVEAMAFAWLARQHVLGRAGNCPSVTGASRPAVLGGWYSPT